MLHSSSSLQYLLPVRVLYVRAAAENLTFALITLIRINLVIAIIVTTLVIVIAIAIAIVIVIAIAIVIISVCRCVTVILLLVFHLMRYKRTIITA